MRRGTRTPEDLDRPQGNSLLENYEKHDVGEKVFIDRCQMMGLAVEEWGIDKRHDDGSAGIIYDDKMDFKVYGPTVPSRVSPAELKAIVDVKTKSNPRYMGRFNQRHYVKYKDHAEHFDVPAFVIMFQVDYESKTVVDEFVFRIDGDAEPFERVHTSDGPAVDRFPDGNDAVLVPHKHRERWSAFEEVVK